MPPQKPKRPDNLLIENARVMFRNFMGLPGQYNDAGDRNFVVFIDKKMADALLKEGWKVKQLKPKDDEPEGQHYLPVEVSYKFRPPRIVLVTQNGKKQRDLEEQDIPQLDSLDVKNWDLLINGNPWQVNENVGIKAYLKTAIVTLDDDPLVLKYGLDDDEDQDPTASLTANDEDLELVDA